MAEGPLIVSRLVVVLDIEHDDTASIAYKASLDVARAAVGALSYLDRVKSVELVRTEVNGVPTLARP